MLQDNLVFLIFFAFLPLQILILFEWKNLASALQKGNYTNSSLIILLFSKVLQKMIIKISGGSKHDIEYNNQAYLKANKIKSTYIMRNKFSSTWRMLSYYMLYSIILMFITKPVDIQLTNDMAVIGFELNKDIKIQLIFIIILVFSNVITDLLSLSFTFVHLKKFSIFLRKNNYFISFYYILKDLAIASVLFIVSQVVSNYLYPYSLSHPPDNFNPFSIQAALMPYGIVKENIEGIYHLYQFVFPGQLLLTGTIFLPTVMCIMILIILSCLLEANKILKKIQNYILSKYIEIHRPIPIGGQPDQTILSREEKCSWARSHFLITSVTAMIAGIPLFILSNLLG